MSRKYYRKKKTSILTDVVYIGNKAPWWFTLTIGSVLFIALYFILPGWVMSNSNSTESPIGRLIFNAVVIRRIHWFQYLGVTIGIICCFYAFRSFIYGKYLSSPDSRVVVFFAKVLARLTG